MRFGLVVLLLPGLYACESLSVQDQETTSQAESEVAFRRVCPDGYIRQGNRCVPAAACGDGACNGSESCDSCAGDCGACPTSCGDGTCDAAEDCTTCSADCGGCSSGALALPGTLEAEAYQQGGEGVGYHDTTLGNAGTGTCRSDDVDMKPSGSGCTIGWFYQGEWLAYDVQVATAGQYLLEARVARGASGSARFHLLVDGVAAGGPIDVPSTGTWETLSTVQAVATLPAGRHVLTVVNDMDYFDFDWLRLTVLVAVCGNAACEAGESCSSCAQDCGTCSTGPCADGSCVTVNVGSSLQAAVDAKPIGTKFLIKAGTHRQQSVVPKTGDAFYCEAGAVLDGENVTTYAFRSINADPDNVVIDGCRITRYTPPSQMAAVNAGYYNASEATTGWRVENCEIDHNANIGLKVGHAMIARNNYLHHNGTMGMGGVGDDVLVEDNEIAYNNPSATGLGFESGGTKFALTHRLIVRNNFCHHNMGPCLWADIGNRDFLFEGNLVEDNLQEGIGIEISYNGIIRNNTLRRNGLDDSRAGAWLWGSGIGIHASGGTGIEVYGNRLEGNAHGISLVQQNRGTMYPGEPQGVIDAQMFVQNVSVHDNIIILQTISGHTQAGSLTAAGGVDDTGTSGLYSRNNHFEHNTYLLNGRTYPFAWANGYRTAAQWIGYGHDDTGTFTP
jgi:parallel beta-helix repeat protein